MFYIYRQFSNHNLPAKKAPDRDGIVAEVAVVLLAYRPYSRIGGQKKVAESPLTPFI